jgi:site-specific recombinase XerD
VQRSLSQAIELCMRLGIAVESLDSMDIDREIVALHFRYDPMRNRMVIRRMTRAGFMITMRGANADIAALYRHRANIVRHSIVTWFQRKHLGQVVPEFAGHRNAGLEFCGAWSMARKEEMTALAKNLGKVVDALFPKTVEVWVKSTADSVDPSITRMLGNWANGAFDKKAICDRKQVLPQRVEDFAMLAAIEKVSEHIWSRYLAEDRTVEELTMAFVILLCTEAGAGRPIAMELVWNVRRRDLQPDGEIAISIHPSDTSERRSRIQLPLKPRLLFYVIAWRQSGCGEHEPLLPPLNKAAEGKQAGSRSRFVELYEEFKAGYLRSVGENAPPLGKILDLGQQLLYHRGIEPAVLTVLNTLPLPVSQPLDRWRTMVRRLRSGIQPPPELVRAKPVETREPGHQRVEIRPQVEEVKDPDSSDEMTPSWCDGAERRMRAVIAKLAEITDKRLVWKTYGEDISRVINEALDAASNEGPNTSVEHLVLRWVRWTLYDGDGITASTVGTYLERMFFRGFLDSEDSRDLSSWDQDDLEGIVEERVEGDGIGASTASDILMVFGMFYRYLSEHEGFKSVDLSDLDVDWSGGAGRSDVLGPVEFDVFLRYRAAPADRESHMRAAASALGYGAGMRPIELSKLSLLDIEEYGDEIRINVLGGKTDAARRAISFSQTASPVAVRCIKEYLALRRSEFGQHGLRGVALFGDQYDRLGYKRRDLSGKVKHDLHAWFGDTIDTYHLRHSFATWLVVRAFMVREPGLRHRLLDASAEIFSDECMARFAVFLSGGKAEKAHRSHESDLRVIAKTMGHLDPETTFRHYVHLFDVIHAHAVLRVDDPQAVLSRQAMTSLLRGIRDSEMSGIREARKIAEICSFLERRLFRGM